MSFMATTEERTNSKGETLTFADIAAVEMPPETKTYKPVPYADIVNFAEDQITGQLGIRTDDIAWKYALAQKGQQFFWQAVVNSSAVNGMAMMLAGHTSLNKTLKTFTVSGAQVLVCTNLCLSGSAFNGGQFTKGRKHTPNCLPDVHENIRQATAAVSQGYQTIVDAREKLEVVGISYVDGLNAIGQALDPAAPVLKAQQATIALKDWYDIHQGNPRHDEFGESTLWSLMNCFTEATKVGAAGSIIGRHIGVHDFFANRVAA